MADALQPYSLAILAAGLMAVLLFAQILIADIAAIWAKTQPGKPLDYNPASFHFRASRSFHNTNESIAVFILLLGVCIALAAQPALVNLMAWAYVAGRIGHMLTYYLGWNLARTLSFVVASLGLLGLIAAGVLAC